MCLICNHFRVILIPFNYYNAAVLRMLERVRLDAEKVEAVNDFLSYLCFQYSRSKEIFDFAGL